jgi:CRP/FNR family transcriptional regulator
MARGADYPDFLPPARAVSWHRARLAIFFSKVPLLKASPAAARALAVSAKVRRVPAGARICEAGKPTRDLWVLLEGRVRVCRPLGDGGSVSLEVMLPGEAFGLPALACWRYPSDIEAITDSTVAALPRAAVQAQMQRSPALARSVLKTLGRRLAFLEAQVSLARRPVATRVAAALVYLGAKFGRKILLTRAEIGALAGTTPETAMRVLKRFERGSLVRSEKVGLFLLEPEALRRQAAVG